MQADPALWWSLTLGLMLIGLVGTIAPFIPGPAIIFGAAVFHHWMVGPEHSAGWVTLGGLLVLTLAALALDVISGSLGAKWFGATWWGVFGGIVGGIVGLFFGLPGLLVGPLLGVMIGEIVGGKGLLPAGKSTWGTVLGTTAGIVVKLIIGLIMIGWFLIAAPTPPRSAPSTWLPSLF